MDSRPPLPPFDADSAAALKRIQEAFRAQILAVDPSLALPF